MSGKTILEIPVAEQEQMLRELQLSRIYYTPEVDQAVAALTEARKLKAA